MPGGPSGIPRAPLRVLRGPYKALWEAMRSNRGPMGAYKALWGPMKFYGAIYKVLWVGVRKRDGSGSGGSGGGKRGELYDLSSFLSDLHNHSFIDVFHPHLFFFFTLWTTIIFIRKYSYANTISHERKQIRPNKNWTYFFRGQARTDICS